MRCLLILVCFFFGVNANAQPVLHSSEMAPFGSSYNYKGLSTFSLIDTSLQGPNQDWDFSLLVPDANPVSSVTIFNPVQTIYADSFPSSNYGMILIPNTKYNFYNLTGGTMELVGAYSPTTGYSNYSNPETQFVFPMAISVSNLDSSMLAGSAAVDTYAFDCLGWGTLHVPGHSYSNVIMRREIVTRSANLTIKKYTWYDSDNGMPVFEYTVATSPSVTEEAKFLYNISSVVNEIESGLFIHYTNPFQSELSIEITNSKKEKFKYELYNSSGQLIANGDCQDFPTIQFKHSFQHADAGIYFFILRQQNNSVTRAKIKLLRLP